MESLRLEELLEKAKKAVVEPARSTERYPNGLARGRFTLFHSAMSFCSQKVRATLVQKGASYGSSDMIIIGSRDPVSGRMIAAENYDPDYVRLRMRGGKQMGLDFASNYTGGSSVSTQGFDACAVPTLVDLQDNDVIIDSVRICLHIDKAISNSPSLVPEDPERAERMHRHMQAVDVTPHPGLLYGFHPDNDTRPEILQQLMVAVYDEKVEALEDLIAKNQDDQEVVEAYKAKIKKESGGKIVSHDEAFQRATRARTRDILIQFDRDIESYGDKWLCGPDVSLADIFWGVSLVRLQYLGLSTLWKDLPAVGFFYSEITNLDAIRDEVITSTVQSMPPSKHLG